MYAHPSLFYLNMLGSKLLDCLSCCWWVKTVDIPFGLSTLINKQTTELHFTKTLQSWPENALSCLLSHKQTKKHTVVTNISDVQSKN